MPSSQNAATERRNDRMISHEPPKLKTTLKTSPKQATNPLQFVKVGPCSLYRTAQEQLQKVQEVKKVKQEVRDDPEDWQSNLDNWKSSRRKRQEHIIERVVEVKKLELEEHDRQRRRSKTFSEMMEERSSRGRKLSMSLAMYHEEDSNDLSDLGIGTSSGKSSVSGDTHDDTQSVLSDRDSEIDKNHSDLDNTSHENGNNNDNNNINPVTQNVTSITKTGISKKSAQFGNGFQDDQREYDSGTTATTSSPEPDEYNYEGAIRYTRAPPQTLPRTSLLKHEPKLESKSIMYEESAGGSDKPIPVVKVDVLKRREIFEKAAQKTGDNKVNNNSNRSSGDFSSPVSIKERLMSLEKQTMESLDDEDKNSKVIDRLSGDMTTIRERLTYLENQVSVRETKISSRKLSNDEFEPVRPLRERLSTLEKYASSDDSSSTPPLPPVKPQPSPRQHVEFTTKVKDRLCSLDSARTTNTNNHNNIIINNNNNNLNDDNVNINTNNNNNIKDVDKKPVDKQILRFNNRERNEISTPSERSSSPDSEYRAPRATFHQSLDSLDADASSEPDTFDRVQSLEELDYVRRRYPTSVSSAEILNDTDREDSGIHTADVSCSVSQADEPVDEEVAQVLPGTSITIEVKPPVPQARNNEDERERVNVQCNQIILEEEADQEKVDVQLESAVIIEESIVIDGSSSDEETSLQCESTESVEHEEEARASEPLTSGNQSAELPLTCPNIEPANNAAPPAIVVDQEIYQDSQSESVASSTPLSYETESNISDYDKPPVVSPLTMAFIEPSLSLSPNIYSVELSNDVVISSSSVYPLMPPTNAEPPKEKPPPPPTDYSDDENQSNDCNFQRLNSTRRIKKDIRTRRSNFLGIEGGNDDDLELRLEVPKPPDMAAMLAEERRIEQMNRRSYDTDSNYEQDSSHERDSGVELGQLEDWTKQPVSPDMSQHSRQSSEPFNPSSSEEDEITKKEREIIEVLEKEEQWRYGNDREQNSDIGEKLAHKLRELEEEKMQLERERAQESVALHRQDESLRKNEEIQPRMPEEDLLRNQQLHLHHHQPQEIVVMQTEVIHEEEIEFREQEKLRFDVERLKLHEEIYDQERRNEIRRQDEMQLRAMGPIREPEHTVVNAVMCDHDDEYASGEVLRVERELLQLEQEALKRQRSNMVYREQKQQQLAEQWQSLQNVNNYTGNIVHATYQNIDIANYRSSMPNLQLQDNQRRRPAPPPIPPAKPLRLIDQRQRDMTIRNSRIPSADSIPQQVDATIRHSNSATALSTHAGHQMTKQTLNALSAVPRTRIVKNDQWVQRRKSDGPRVISQDLNYQHWLIQEAEQRRINEKNQRSPPQRKPQQHVTGTSVPYTATTTSYKSEGKPLPDSIIQTLTQRIQNRAQERPLPLRRRIDHSVSQEHLPQAHHQPSAHFAMMHQKAHQSPGTSAESQEKLLSVSGKKKCSHCGDELGRGAAMIIESLRLFYHMECFKCCVCHVRLGDGLMGTDVRVRNHKLHCHNCYSSDDGVKFSCV